MSTPDGPQPLSDAEKAVIKAVREQEVAARRTLVKRMIKDGHTAETAAELVDQSFTEVEAHSLLVAAEMLCDVKDSNAEAQRQNLGKLVHWMLGGMKGGKVPEELCSPERLELIEQAVEDGFSFEAAVELAVHGQDIDRAARCRDALLYRLPLFELPTHALVFHPPKDGSPQDPETVALPTPTQCRLAEHVTLWLLGVREDRG